MAYRTEHDALGEVLVPAERSWGAQTQRSVQNFPIGVGREVMPPEIIRAFGLLKKAAARANRALLPEKMTPEKLRRIEDACDRTGTSTPSLGLVDAILERAYMNSGSSGQLNRNDLDAAEEKRKNLREVLREMGQYGAPTPARIVFGAACRPYASNSSIGTTPTYS